MYEMLSRMSSGQVEADISKESELILVVGGFLLLGIVVIAFTWGSIRHAEIRTALKKDMLERGMSADDIEKVIRAKSA